MNAQITTVEHTQHSLMDYFRLPEDWAGAIVANENHGEAGFFRFGEDAICYGPCSPGHAAEKATDVLHDLLDEVSFQDGSVRLPFDPAQVFENLRFERYMEAPNNSVGGWMESPLVKELYYLIRPALPVNVRIHLQRMRLGDWPRIQFPAWPVDSTVDILHSRLLGLLLRARSEDRVPFIWFWPEGARGAFIMTHDVETSAGRDFCSRLMDIDEEYGVKSSFQVVPEERYEVPASYLAEIRERGFELNVHDLNHDGRLYREREEFLRRVQKINHYAREFGSVGFRAGAMHHNLSSYDALDFIYDMSVPNIGHLEAQRGGCCTVLPYSVGKILELPLTTTQDYSLFHILHDYSLSLWKRQVALILEKHGLISFIVHPDYVIEPRPQSVYRELLAYLSETLPRERIWSALPRDVARWWLQRSQMRLVQRAGSWQIEGEGSERARLAYAVLRDGRLCYERPA